MRAIAPDAITPESQLSARFIPSVPPTLGEPLDFADQALLELGRALKRSGYRFTTITPASHARVLARPLTQPASLTDIFGWSRQFRLGELDDQFAAAARAADVLEQRGGCLKSSVRFSTLRNQLFVHSAFPTDQADTVFFGPDTYRFARMIGGAIAGMHFRRRKRIKILDLGAGSGAGGLDAAALLSDLDPRVTLSDINRRALRYCRINAALNGVDNVDVVESDLFANVGGSYDLIIANPPYLADKLGRTYRHGGGEFGSELSVRIVEEGVPHLAPGGRLVLYTGSAIVGGRDYLHETLTALLHGRALRMSYEEIDPDVFGEELDHSPYDRVDRIAVIGVTVDFPEGDKHAARTR